MENRKIVFLEPCRPKRPSSKPSARIENLDPDAMIRSAVAGLADPATSAEDLFVAWLLALPHKYQPAEAATLLLTAYWPGGHEPHNDIGRRIIQLLQETSGTGSSEPVRAPARRGDALARRLRRFATE